MRLHADKVMLKQVKKRGEPVLGSASCQSVSWVYGSAEKGEINRRIIEAVGLFEPWEQVGPWLFMQLRFLHGHVCSCVPQDIIECVSNAAVFAWRYYGEITWCSQSHVVLESFQMQHCCECLALLCLESLRGDWGNYCRFGFFSFKRS